MINVEQDALCDYCEDNEINNRASCEGNSCDRARELYLDNYGISKPEGFSAVGVTDILYVIDARKIQRVTVEYIKTTREVLTFKLVEWVTTISVSVGDDDHSQRLFLTKDEAIAGFKQLMAYNLAEYQDNLIAFITEELDNDNTKQ